MWGSRGRRQKSGFLGKPSGCEESRGGGGQGGEPGPKGSMDATSVQAGERRKKGAPLSQTRSEKRLGRGYSSEKRPARLLAAKLSGGGPKRSPGIGTISTQEKKCLLLSSNNVFQTGKAKKKKRRGEKPKKVIGKKGGNFSTRKLCPDTNGTSTKKEDGSAQTSFWSYF